MEQQERREGESPLSKEQAATIYVSTYRAFRKHCQECEKCRENPPTTMMHCSFGFFLGHQVKTSHDQLLAAF